MFLFAHQDDEIGVLSEIELTIARGERAVCIYLTNGNWNGADPETRNRESLRVLCSLGVDAEDIHFPGTSSSISDGNLAQSMKHAYGLLYSLLEALGGFGRIVTHAWEGGHQDHDAAHVLGVVAAADFGVLAGSRQFALYRFVEGSALPYRVFVPIGPNGPVTTTGIPLRRRLRYLGNFCIYRSQWRAMLGLVPFIAWDYATGGGQKLQPLSTARILERPHCGRLLYERRHRLSYEEMRAAVTDFLAWSARTPRTRESGTNL
ncbi:MAG: PIG-L family deacetylase [Hyphomicrobium sp.]